MATSTQPDLWTLALDEPHIGPADLADALEREACRGSLDFRTRLLIRDSLDALRQAWGEQRLAEWLSHSKQSDLLNLIWRDRLAPPGFPSLCQRIMEPTRTDVVLQFLRELGQNLDEPVAISVGGSVALILAGVLSRRTEHIDVVDEVPVHIRGRHELLANLARRYSLRLADFQSHYLPGGWEKRLVSLGTFDQLQVRLVHPGDVFFSKLLSNREKDKDDLRVLTARTDKAAIIALRRDAAGALVRGESLRKQAEKNWHVLYGEPLPEA